MGRGVRRRVATRLELDGSRVTFYTTLPHLLCGARPGTRLVGANRGATAVRAVTGMAVWRYVSFNIPEAQRLADLAGVDHDLEATTEICDLLLMAIDKGDPLRATLLDALSSAALVRYARSFATGVRMKLPAELLGGLTTEQLKDHQSFLDLRDKFVAHSVNAFELNNVVAYLVPEERGARDVSSISVQQHRLLSLGIDDANNLKALALELRRRLRPVIEAEKTKVLAVARARPMDAMYTQVDPPPEVARRGDEGKARRAHRPPRRR